MDGPSQRVPCLQNCSAFPAAANFPDVADLQIVQGSADPVHAHPASHPLQRRAMMPDPTKRHVADGGMRADAE